MVTVTLYRKNECDECENILQLLGELLPSFPHQVVVVNVDELGRCRERLIPHTIPLRQDWSVCVAWTISQNRLAGSLRCLH